MEKEDPGTEVGAHAYCCRQENRNRKKKLFVAASLCKCWVTSNWLKLRSWFSGVTFKFAHAR